jgi:hypothetical protein
LNIQVVRRLVWDAEVDTGGFNSREGESLSIAEARAVSSGSVREINA